MDVGVLKGVVGGGVVEVDGSAGIGGGVNSVTWEGVYLEA